MKVLLIGCGAVGIGVATALYKAGVRTALIARGATAQAVRSGGIGRRGILGEYSVPAERLEVFGDVSQAGGGYDYVLVAAKTTANAEIAESLRNREIFAPGGKLLLFQNGIGGEEAFLKAVDKKDIYSGSFAIGFIRPSLNMSEVTVFSRRILIGSPFGAGSEPVAELAACIDRGGIPCEATEEIGKYLWAKMLYNCALNPLSAILRVPYGGLVASESSVALLRTLIDEMFDVMHAAGYETFWKDSAAYQKEFFESILPPTYGHRSSTLQDMERKIPTEIDTLNGAVVRLGERFQVPTPCNAMLVKLVKAAEGLYDYPAG